MAQPYAPEDALGLVGVTVDQVRFDACVDAGGFGLIYKGFHQGLGEHVAIKALRIASIQKTNEAIREALAGRFRDETKLLYRLSQGNLDIVRCISSGTTIAPRTNEYTPYMVLEWLDGCTLSAELKERRERRLGARTLKAAVALLDSAASGIAYAHTHDVVHRDVKPGNLFLTRTREGVRMKVLDFGLAKILSDEAIGVRPSVETGVGVHFCSPSYGAPEQFTSQAGAIGPWTDVYSLCLVLLEVMTGEKVRPAGNLAQGLLAALDPERGSPTASSLGLKVPRAAEALLKRAVAQDPKERPHDVGVFWLELKDAMNGANDDAASTVFDGSGAPSAMLEARERALAMMGQNKVEERDAASAQPSPFAGTMIMDNAPSLPGKDVPAPLPAAGRPIADSATLETAPNGVITAPLSPPMTNERPVSAVDRMKGTLPLGAVNAGALALPTPGQPIPQSNVSPLAASMAIASPLASQSFASQAQQQPQQQQHLSYPPGGVPTNTPTVPPQRTRGMPTDPRMELTRAGVAQREQQQKNRLALSLIAMIVAALVVLGGVGFYLLRLRHH